ncbi:MAG TPA: hypothetical protein VH682_29530, partial [Gemmataceae bacterium]
HNISAIARASLPHNSTTLAALMQSITRTLDYMEPLRQQLDNEARILDQLDRVDLSRRDLDQLEQQFRLFSESLRRRIAQGGPDHSLIGEYLELSDMPGPPLQLFVALRAIEHRRGTADERPAR